jgi:hypothetical protein
MTVNLIWLPQPVYSIPENKAILIGKYLELSFQQVFICMIQCSGKKSTAVLILEVLYAITNSDVDINTSDTSTPTQNQISGPITQARSHQLNNQVSSFLASYSSYLDNVNLCSILLLRNDGQEGNGVAFGPVTFGFQNSISL